MTRNLLRCNKNVFLVSHFFSFVQKIDVNNFLDEQTDNRDLIGPDIANVRDRFRKTGTGTETGTGQEPVNASPFIPRDVISGIRLTVENPPNP